VTDHNDRVIGVVTDRDISIAMGAADITVRRRLFAKAGSKARVKAKGA
jgi:CBS domain-containing protein